MRKLRWAWGLAVLVPLWAAQAHAEGVGVEGASKPPPQITETSGLALGIVLSSTLIGLRADYLFRVPQTFFHFGVYAAGGAVPCVNDDALAAGAQLGALGSWGHRHRMFIESFGGTLGCLGLNLQGQRVANRGAWGVAMQLGYEHMGPSGFFARIGAGIVLFLEPAIEPLSRRIGPALTLLHAGWKLW